MIQKDLLRRALTDSETGLPNHRFLELERERLAARSERYGFPVGLITITCHGCEQQVFQRFVRLAAETVRRADCLARTGPAELQLMVTHRDTEQLPTLVKRLRHVARDFEDEGFEIEVRWAIESAEQPDQTDVGPL